VNEETFQRKLAALIAEIGTINNSDDRDRLTALAEQTKVKHADLRTTVASLQDNISFVRLSIKYLLFDLEATRRENAHLRKMLEEDA